MDPLYTILVKYPDSEWQLWNRSFHVSPFLLQIDAHILNKESVNAIFKVCKVLFSDL